MAKFGGIGLGAEGVGVFDLVSESDDEDFTYESPDGASVTIPANSRYIVVTNCPRGGFEETHARALDAANRAIDVHFSHGGRPLLLAHKDSPYIVGWNSDAGMTLRIIGKNQISTRLTARAVAYDSSGKVLEPPAAPSGAWHQSLRYYRISESSTDLFDSFRNLYLALESLLSWVVPPHPPAADGRREGEGTWLKRALKQVGEQVDLQLFAPASPRSPSNAIYDELYRKLRTAIFHAKSGRTTWTPQDWRSRAPITEARYRYALMFRALTIEYLETKYSSGGLVAAGRELMAESLHRGYEIFVSNDKTKLEDEPAGEYQLAPAGGKYITLRAEESQDTGNGQQFGVIGAVKAIAANETLGEVRRFGTLREGNLAVIEGLRAALVLDGVQELQVELVLDLRNYGEPKQDFES
ncbi:hypothetical protein [Arthrobacter sp. NPDC092385]|uniref:hypothetical protein n=1 Tax=Arthrobacter sp. NPDC092385 TaxID=3363943 RepID=UPI0038236A6F